MNLLITGAFDWTQSELNKLCELGHRIHFMQNEKDILPCEAEWVEGIVGNGIFLYHSIEHFQNLKYVQLTSAGFDRVPITYIKEHNIKIFNARGVYSIPMAEFALCGVLQLYKQCSFFEVNQQNHCWKKHRGLLELYKKSVCIIGCGSVGNECAKRFRCFGCNVVGVDIKPYKSDLYEEMFSLEALDCALSRADIAVLTLPLTEKTHNLINSGRLAIMKSNSILVNIARGAIVDTNALITAVNKNIIGGAVLDVFSDEPLPSNSLLWDLDNVIITPHNSFVSEGNHNRMLDVIMNNLKGL